MSNNSSNAATISHFDIENVEEDTGSNYVVSDLRTGEMPLVTGWMTRLLLNKEFQMVSATNLQAVFSRFSPMHLDAGQVVIKQGSPGEYFYVVTAGSCVVTREIASRKNSLVLAELVVGDTFGEEALITGAQRQATVTMVTDGAVMKLSKEDFKSLVSDPIIEFITQEEAESLVAAGGQWIDVGTTAQVDSSKLPGAIHIPMQILRHKCHTLSAAKQYIVTCADTSHSCAAAHVLRQYGIDVNVLSS